MKNTIDLTQQNKDILDKVWMANCTYGKCKNINCSNSYKEIIACLQRKKEAQEKEA